MKTCPDVAPYRGFVSTFTTHGTSGFRFEVLEVCAAEPLLEREIFWMLKEKPSENTTYFCAKGVAYSEDERLKRAERTAALWRDPEYRKRSVEARLGKAYNKGYKCTPEQTKNRQKAGRISNMKRNYGEQWREEYLRRYPEHAEDVRG
jgi:hypothetical protein